MKRNLVLAALAATLLIPLSAEAKDWPIAKDVTDSVVYIEHKGGSCSGIVIDSSRNHILTAAHCDLKDKDDILYADQHPAKVVWKDVKSDLMVLKVEDMQKPALQLSSKNPEPGLEVASIGYGYGWEKPMFRVAHVSISNSYVGEGLTGEFVILDIPFVSGQSGGPVVDADGRLVSIVQASNNLVAIGRGAEEIRRKVGKYFTIPGAAK